MTHAIFSKNADEPIHTATGWLSRQGFGHFGYAFREAADALCEAPALTGRSDEAMYLVASFAYRQSIELYLKSILSQEKAFSKIASPRNFHAQHQLLVVWDWINERLVAGGNSPLPKDARSPS